MINWQKFPFIRFCSAFILGILTQLQFKNEWNFVGYFLAIGTISYIILWWVQKRIFKTNLKPYLGFNALLILVLFGNLMTYFHIDINSNTHLSQCNINQIKAYQGVVIEPIVEKDKSFKTTIKVKKVLMDSNWILKKGKVLVYFQKSTESSQLQYGDILYISGSFNELNPPKNPNAFDYKDYLANRNIFHQGYIKINSFEITSNQSPNFLIEYALKTRFLLETKLAQFFSNEREKGIALALILGVKDDLENEIREVYSEVGAMHVLAVSGLHVGLVYQLFLWLLQFFNFQKYKLGVVVKTILLILLIWVYAFITGLSPSVLRAATMFSFVILGQAINRKSSIYNTLAISAFILLCFNPFLIKEVGFQLSYLAVIGIVYLQPKIYEWIDVPYLWLDKIWVITSVSIAAQIATSPISIYYFHQFPNYFFISNLIAIPAATFILSIGLLNLALSWFDWASKLITYVLEKLIFFTNEAMLYVSKLPYSSLKKLEISTIQTLLLYGFILLILLFVEKRKLSYFKYAFVLLFIFSGINLYNWKANNQTEQIIVYDVPNYSAIGLRNGHNMIFLYSDSLYQEEQKMKFSIFNHWQKSTIKNIEPIPIGDNYTSNFTIKPFLGNTIVVWNTQKILLIDKPLDIASLNQNLYFDIIILRENVQFDDEFFDNIFFKTLITDASCKKWYTQIHQEFLTTNFAHIVNEEGAFVLEL